MRHIRGAVRNNIGIGITYYIVIPFKKRFSELTVDRYASVVQLLCASIICFCWILTNVLLSYNTFGGTAFMFPKIPVERSVWTSVAPCGTRLRHWSSGGILSFCKV